MQCYEAGLIAATLCGPPCETFSEARFTELPAAEGRDRPRGPRPLRSFNKIIGLPHLTFKEIRQTRQGTAFMLQMQHVLALHLCHGGYYLEEHPAPPKIKERPSLWTAPVTELLRSHPGVRLHIIPQRLFGADSIKPTGVLAAQLPSFARHFWQHKDNDAVRPSEVSIGLNAEGAFKTSHLKEYPTRLSKAFASAVWSQLRSDYQGGRVTFVKNPPATLMHWLQQAAASSRKTQEAEAMRADYQDQFAQ